MAVRHGYGKLAGTDALVFAYDTGDTINSYKGEPTINYIPGTYSYGLYAYASGPVDISTLNEKNQTVTARRYTITSAVNTARGAIFITSVTTGVFYTFSIKWRYTGITTTSPLFLIDATKGNPEVGGQNTYSSSTITTNAIGNGWYLSTFIFSFSASLNNGAILTFGISTGTTSSYIGETFDVYEAQFEIKNHKTPYSNGTRSATQGLLDLTGKGTIDLTNTSFNTNAQPFFDGVDDRIVVPYSGTDLNGDPLFTVEGIFKRTGASMSARGFWGLGGDISDQGISGYTYGGSGNNIAIDLWGRKTYRTGVDYPLNQYVHVVWVKSAPTFTVNTVAIYINGVEYTGASFIVNRDNAATVNLNTGNVGKGISIGRIGPQTNTYYGVGEIPVFKVYNKALTVDEINNNYNHYKTRFNL